MNTFPWPAAIRRLAARGRSMGVGPQAASGPAVAGQPGALAQPEADRQSAAVGDQDSGAGLHVVPDAKPVPGAQAKVGTAGAVPRPRTGRRPLTLLALSALVVAWGGGTAGWPGPRWRVWERALEDQLLVLRGPRRPPRRVLVVPVDDATLQQGSWFEQNRQIPGWARGIGTLPWPRAAYGQVAARLLDGGAAAVAINVVFEGPSRNGPADDAALEAILRAHPGRIVLAAEMLESSDQQGAGALTLVRPELFMAAIGGQDALGLTNTPLREPGGRLLHPEAYGRGLLPAQGVKPFPSLSATLLQRAGGASRQNDALTALNAYGTEGSFRRLPAWEVLDPSRWRRHPQRADLAGALVLLGPVVSQGDDGYPTPFGSLSGLELLATATANSLQGDGLRSWPAGNRERALLVALVLLLAAGLALARRSLAWRLAVIGAVLGLQLAWAGWALGQRHLWLPLLAPAAGLGLLALVHAGDAYLLEERERRRLRRTFERYVAPGVVAEILADPQAAQGILRGRLLDVTVLFSDLKGFTELTRQRSLAGQSELHVRQLNTYLGAMVEVITAHGGTVDKFIGDAVMAVFGSPVGRGVQVEARAAVTCAQAMRQALAQLNQDWEVQGLTRLDSGVGLASGQVVVGQIGSPRRMEFTVIGDTVNLAARLEGLTRSLRTSVLFDRTTAERLDPACAAPVSLGLQPVKGMGDIEVFRPAAPAELAVEASSAATQPPLP
ncbi:MAG: adenylate/guanylate cyclase domain-containing protein [Synechococcaceae cyanobacterium ELA739]